MTSAAIWPPPLAVSVSTDSSHRIVSKPSCWNTALETSGAILALSQLSVAASLSASVHVEPFGQSWPLFNWFGRRYEKLGKRLLVRSPANCESGTMLFVCAALL